MDQRFGAKVRVFTNVAAFVLTVGMIAYAPSLGFAMGRVPTEAMPGALTGKAAYDATLPTALSGPSSLSQARGGKKTVLFFWATWCPHCHEEIGHMVNDLNAITAKGINIILVSVGETKEDVTAYLRRNHVPLNSFVDEEGVLQEPYGLFGVPMLFFVDEQGIIRGQRNEFPKDYDKLFSAP